VNVGRAADGYVASGPMHLLPKPIDHGVYDLHEVDVLVFETHVSTRQP